ncbi:MAG: hypothetical protein Q8K30_01335 [Candidatus Gracilibacteria bacterium]|nr:hypothetical protein [Candidatus Gracilibacteria bacterium]
MIKISKILKKSLWEYDITNMNYNDEILIIRALNFGELSDIKIISKNIGEKKVLDIFLKNITNIDNKSKNFWEIYFNLKKISKPNISMYEQINKPIFKRSFG